MPPRHGRSRHSHDVHGRRLAGPGVSVFSKVRQWHRIRWLAVAARAWRLSRVFSSSERQRECFETRTSCRLCLCVRRHACVVAPLPRWRDQQTEQSPRQAATEHRRWRRPGADSLAESLEYAFVVCGIVQGQGSKEETPHIKYYSTLQN